MFTQVSTGLALRGRAVAKGLEELQPNWNCDWVYFVGVFQDTVRIS